MTTVLERPGASTPGDPPPPAGRRGRRVADKPRPRRAVRWPVALRCSTTVLGRASASTSPGPDGTRVATAHQAPSRGEGAGQCVDVGLSRR